MQARQGTDGGCPAAQGRGLKVRRAFEKKGIASLDLSEYASRVGHLTATQKAHYRAHQPRDTNVVLAWQRETFGIGYSQPSTKGVFDDALHQEHQTRPARGLFYKPDRPVVQKTTGRQWVNIHGAPDLEEMRLVRVAGERINAETTLALFNRIKGVLREVRIVRLFLDNARYHHARMLRSWLERPEFRLKLHFLPPYAPHLNPIKRLWGVMHRHVTHNLSNRDFQQFTEAVDELFDEYLQQIRETFRSTVTDNFRVITNDEHCLIG